MYFAIAPRDFLIKQNNTPRGIVQSELRNIERIIEDLDANYHKMQHFITQSNWDERSVIDQVSREMVIRKTMSTKNTVKIKYSFTSANVEQYTHHALAYMQAQRFFVEHCIKESKQILGLDQFQTRKWLAWQHQVALNFLVSSFIFKVKLHCFDYWPLLSARGIKEWFVFKLYKEMTEEQFFNRMYDRHLIRQLDINISYIRI